MIIRPYDKKDFRYVQDICLATSSYGEDDNPTNRAWFTALYCDYFIDNQPEFCFVAVNDDDIPVGYVLCASDWIDYTEKMGELYLPLVRKVNSGEFFKFNALMKVEQRYIRQGYTACFYLDILNEYKDQSLAQQLLEKLCDELKSADIEGVRVLCSKNNVEACSFYETSGFEDIDYITGAVVYGKKF